MSSKSEQILREKLDKLDDIEKKIATSLQFSGKALEELTKDKPVAKQVDTNTNNFVKTVKEIEKELTDQINYLTQISTGLPYDGTPYGDQKDFEIGQGKLANMTAKCQTLYDNFSNLQQPSGSLEPS